MTDMVEGVRAGGREDRDVTVHRGRNARIGRFRCPAEDPRFGPWEATEEHLFVFPRTSVTIEHEGRDGVVADPNHVMLYNRGDVYRRSLISERGDLCEWFAIEPGLLFEAIRAHDPSVADRPDRPLTTVRGPCSREAYALQRMLYRHATESDAPDAMMIDEGVLGLVDLVAASASVPGARRDRGTGRGDRLRSEEAVRVMNRRFTERLSLDDVADAVGLSTFHFCRVFKRCTGTTVHRYLTRLRLRTALELVAERGSDLTRVALELGFSSHSHFTDCFRREFGITPSRFRDPSSARERALVRALMGGLASG